MQRGTAQHTNPGAFMRANRQATRARRVRIGLLAAGLLLLSACTPTWDWREIRPVDEPVAVMLPAKPASMTRDLSLAGAPVKMTMHGALVEGQRFTVAWIRLDKNEEGDAGAAAATTSAAPVPPSPSDALDAMQTGMLSNIAGTIDREEARTVRVIDTAGNTIAQREGRFIDASGQAQGEAVRLQGLFVGSGRNLVQFVVIGQPWSDDAAATFFESAALRRSAGD